MSDASQGPGWWLASDGRWYPPESIPPPPPPPPETQKPGVIVRPTSEPGGQPSFWKRLGVVRQALLITALGLILLATIGHFSGGAGTSGGTDSPEYTAARTYCTDTAGAAWYVSHPGASADNAADLRGFAGAVNRCLIDRLGVSPKYLPADKPIEGIRP